MSKRSPLIKSLRCICCEIVMVEQQQPTQEHHLNLGGHAGMKRLGDEYSVALCEWHHVGYPPGRMTASQALHTFGPSLARHSKAFRSVFGNDQKLLDMTNERLTKL